MVAVAASRALSTGVQVAVTRRDRLPAAQAVVMRRLDDIDRAVSRFRADSEIGRVNTARGRAVTVTDLCLRAVRVALRVAEQTGGAVDPTVGTTMEALGYDRDFGDIDAAGTVRAAVPAPGWRCVDVDDAASTVRVPEGVHLDLGASAKAFVADEAAAAAAAASGCGVLVNLGGDLATAGAPPEAGWEVRVTDDHAAGPGAPGQTVRLQGGGLATSSTTVRRWRRGAGEAHHIVDPRTGEPAPVCWRTVSLAAATCVDANAAATAAIVLGAAAPEWLSRRGLAARLVASGGAVVHLGGWPEAGEQG